MGETTVSEVGDYQCKGTGPHKAQQRKYLGRVLRPSRSLLELVKFPADRDCNNSPSVLVKQGTLQDFI